MALGTIWCRVNSCDQITMNISVYILCCSGKIVYILCVAIRSIYWGGQFCAPAFSYVLRTKKGPLLCYIVLLQFHRLEASRPASKPASKLA